MNLFTEFPLPSVLQQNLARHGFVNPTEVQTKAIPAALTGADVAATAQTGTGKTLAFLLPVLHSLMESRPAGVGAVILTPTRELAIQIHEAFQKLSGSTGIRAAVVVGGLNENSQLREIRSGAHVLIATPGRLIDFLTRRLVKLATTRILVLDEADRMLDMGFLPAIERIVSALPEDRQTLFFSATIERSIVPLIGKYLRNPVRLTIGTATKASENVDLHLYEVEHERKVDLLHSLLGRDTGSFLVFARTKRGTDRLAKRLSQNGVKAVGIHGDRTQNQRNQALRGFKDGRYRVLVATDVAARGIHVEGIAHVVNFDLPQASEDFIHRVGRTGRAGNRGVASTFAMPSERGALRMMEKALKTKLIRQTWRDEGRSLEPVSHIVPVVAQAEAARPAEYARKFRPSWNSRSKTPR